jgi:hypothetical protein
MSLYLSNQYLSNHYWLIADQRFRLGVAITLPCVFLALAWRTIASKDPPQEPPSTEKSSTRAQAPSVNPTITEAAAIATTKSATVAPATNTRVTMRAPNPITTAKAPTQAPAVPPKATAAVREPRARRTAPEKKPEVVVVQTVEEERPATPGTPTSKPKRKSTITTAETATPPPAQDRHQQQHISPAPRQNRLELDSASISSGGSSEHQSSSSSSSNYKNKTLRMGKKTLQRAWSKRPFAGNSPAAAPVHGEASILFPDSPTIPSVLSRG